MTRYSPSMETSPSNLPCVESYLSRWAIISMGVRSLMATTLLRSSLDMARNTLRPIRPKPLIAYLAIRLRASDLINYKSRTYSSTMDGASLETIPPGVNTIVPPSWQYAPALRPAGRHQCNSHAPAWLSKTCTVSTLTAEWSVHGAQGGADQLVRVGVRILFQVGGNGLA